MEHLQTERRIDLPASHPHESPAAEAVREAIGLQACLGTVGAVEYLKAHGINGAVIGRVLSGGQVREDDRAMTTRNDAPSTLQA